MRDSTRYVSLARRCSQGGSRDLSQLRLNVCESVRSVWGKACKGAPNAGGDQSEKAVHRWVRTYVDDVAGDSFLSTSASRRDLMSWV